MKLKSIKVKQHIPFETLRSLCIEYGWYTRGTNEDYDHLFEMARNMRKHDALGIRDIFRMADDIKKHSATSCDVPEIMEILNELIITEIDAEEEEEDA